MSTINSSTDHLTLNADGASKDIKFQANGVEKAVIDSSGNVGIGVASPTKKLDVYGESIISWSGANTYQYFQSTSNYVGRKTDGNLHIGVAGGQDIVCDISGAEKLRIQSGGGISFNGDTAAANALDDYEEGTWTPTFEGSLTNPTVSYTLQRGTYTKIGDTVFVNIYLVTASVSGGSGNLRISGLPFTAITSASGYGSQAGNIQNWSSLSESIGGFPSGTQLLMKRGHNTDVTTSNLRTTGDSNQIWWSLSYKV